MLTISGRISSLNVRKTVMAAERGFYPEPLAQRFDAERWMDWQQTTLNPAGRDAFVQLIRTEPARRRPERVEASIAATEPRWALLDRHLARSPFMAGPAFTIADIPIVCEVHRWRGSADRAA